MRPTAVRQLKVLVAVKRCVRIRVLGAALSRAQVYRLCGQDTSEPSADGRRHQRQALHGAHYRVQSLRRR